MFMKLLMRTLIVCTCVIAVCSTFIPFAGAKATNATGMVIGNQENPTSLNPLVATSRVEMEIGQAIFDNLFRMDNTGKLIPSLAVEVPSLNNGGISSDGRTYSIKLRKDVRWHDGEPFTSADVKFTIDYARMEDSMVSNKDAFRVVDKVATSGDYAITIHTEGLSRDFLETFANPGILPSHCFTGLGDKELANALGPNGEFGQKPIGTGPFKFISQESFSSVFLEANPDYFLGKPKVSKLTWRYMTEPEVVIPEGAIDKVRMTYRDFEPIRSYPGLKLIRDNNLAFLGITLDTNGPVLGDKLVRQALAYALPKKEIVDWSYRGYAVPAPDTIVPLASWLSNPKLTERYSYDTFNSRTLLDRAGWRTGPGNRRMKDGQPLLIRLSVNQDLPWMMTLAQHIIRAWENLGSTVIIDSTTLVDMDIIDDLPRFDALLVEWYARATPGLYSLFHSSMRLTPEGFPGINYSGLQDRALDKVLEKADTILDPEEYKALIYKAQEMIAEDEPIIMLYNYSDCCLVPVGMKNYKPSPFANTDMWNVYEWDLD